MRLSPVQLISPLFLFLIPACYSAEERSLARIHVDTLPNGAVHVLNPAEGVWARAQTEPWEVREDLRIGVVDGDPRYLFGEVRDVMPREDGAIWVMDSQAHELRLYDSDGAWVRTMGGKGGGPGEFGFNPCAFSGPNGEIWVESGRRWQWFDSAGAYIGGQLVTRRFGCAWAFWISNDLFYAMEGEYDSSGTYDHSLLRHDRHSSKRGAASGGDLVATDSVVLRDTVAAPDPPDPPMVRFFDAEGRAVINRVVPFVHRPTYRFSRDHVWISDGGGEYRIRRQTLQGDTVMVIDRAFEPVPIADSAREVELAGLAHERFQRDPGFDPASVPHTYPPFDRLIPATDGSLWVRRQVDGGRFVLDVFDPEGRYLGQTEVPQDFGSMRIQHVDRRFMYGSARDEMGVAYVVRLRIRKPEAEERTGVEPR